MINSLLSGIQKLFGNKADKDVREIEPLVHNINTEYEKLHVLSNDELRAKTAHFKNQVNDYLADIDAQISNLKARN